MFFFVLLAAVFLQDAKQAPKQEKPDDAKDALRKIIIDLDKEYRQCMKNYDAARTTADQQDASNENFLVMEEWIKTQDNTEIEFECVFIDIIRSDEYGFMANFSVPRQLLLFCPPTKKPLRCRPTLSLPADSDLRDALVRGMKVTMNARLSLDRMRSNDEETVLGNGMFDIVLWNSPGGIPRFLSPPIQTT